jgi:SNF2-related domain/Helicase conserved C-terminal domain
MSRGRRGQLLHEDLMVTFGNADIARTIEPATLRRGHGVHADGLVLDIDVNPSSSAIVGRVRGSEGRPYQQVITVKPGGSGVIINGICSCPMRVNCKHVAAVLLEAVRRAQRYALAVPAATAVAQGAVTMQPQPQKLSVEIARWLGDVDTTTRGELGGNDYPPDIKQRLIYVIEAASSRGAAPARPHVQPMVATLNKAGTFGASAKHYSPSNISGYQPAKHLRPIDYDILGEMEWLMRRIARHSSSAVPLTAHPQWAGLMHKILATGRCRWGSVQGPLLSAGPVLAAKPRWVREAGAAGRQRLTIEPVADAAGVVAILDAVLAIAPPFYVDLAAGVAGPLDLGLAPSLAAQIATAPAVSLSEAAQFTVALETRLAALGIKDVVPLPELPVKSETRHVRPTPHLELFVGDVRIKQAFSWYVTEQNHRGAFKLPLARLAFDYGGEIVPLHAKGDVIERFDGELLIVTPRDSAFELNAHQALGARGLKPLNDAPFDVSIEHSKDLYFAPPNGTSPYEFLETFDDPSKFMAFSADAVPQLVNEGWQVSFSDDYPYRIAEGDIGWWADIEKSGIDWFSFELGIDFEGQRINLAPQLATMLSRLPQEMQDLALSPKPEAAAELTQLCSRLRLYHTLPDGRLLPLPGERLAPMLKALMELIGPRGNALETGKVRLHRADVAALTAAAATLGDRVAWSASADRLMALGNDLRRGRALKDIVPPPSFKAQLRPYQAQGFAWLDFLRETGFGGVLADDMGLGKTVQALAYLTHEKAEGRLDRPALIIAPTSVLPNWQAEAQRFAPGLKVLALRGLDRKQLFSEISGHDLVLTTYPLLTRDHDVLLEQEFHAAILDEAQAIKNPNAIVSRLAHRLNARHRLALTGTPLENNLGEVWSLFEFLSPGLLGDERTFRRTFRTPIEKHGCQAAQSFLTRRLKPFMLRRTKQEVATELPAKTEIIERIRLEGGQRDLYETVRVLMHAKVRDEIAKKGLAKSHIIFLDALLKLRQICCDPRLLKMPQARKVKQSAKLERLMEMLPEMVAEGRRILLFSQFTSMLELIEAELDARKIPYVILTGSTKDRAIPVKAFQSGEVPVFLLSLKAGGTGLNLTAADTVIHYDPWWNPAVESQATDRAYRIGQTKPVFVYKFVAQEGIEEAIELLKVRKAALADALFAGASKTGLDLTEADISALFAPLGAVVKRKAA